MSSKRLTEEQRQQLRAALLVDELPPFSQIAKTLSVDEGTVRYHAQRLGVKGQHGRRRLTEEQIAEIDQMLTDSKPVDDIVRQAGVSEETVRRRKKALGLLERDVVYLDPPYPPTDGSQPCAADPELFFVTIAGSRQSVQLRQRIESLCGSCPFARPCLAYALAHNVDGWWAGTSKPQRAALRRKHGITARPVLGWHIHEPSAPEGITS